MTVTPRTSNRQVPGHVYEYHAHVYGAESGSNYPIVAGMLLEHPNAVTTTINKRWESDKAVSIIKMLLRRIPTKDMYTLTALGYGIRLKQLHAL